MNYKIDHVSEGVLYLINATGKLRALYTPFRVRCTKESIGIPVNTWVFVDAVYINDLFKIGYLINNNVHPYNHFQITISF